MVAQCAQHGGDWGGDTTCPVCTDGEGNPRALPEGAAVRELTASQQRELATMTRDLANTLYRFVYGGSLWKDDEQYENYIADAKEIIESHPHLLPLRLRADMEDPDA